MPAKPQKRIHAAVLGDGAWGTALALVLHANGHRTTLWGAFRDNIENIRRDAENRRFLPGVPLGPGILPTDSMEEAAAEADLIVLASPSQYLRGTLEKLKPFFRRDRQIITDISKGIETGTLLRMSELVEEVLGKTRYSVLSGPSHAEEVSRGIPTAVVTASQSPDTARFVQSVFINDNFRVYTSRDVTGVELGGALKNVFAIAAGMIDGIGLGDNTKAALMTRGIAEMARLGKALGGQRRTFSGLSGIGDLIVTCMSRHSRNRHVGEELGRGKKLDQITAEMGMVVAEGVKTAISAHMLAGRKQCETPIINEVFNVLYNDLSPKDAVADLMNRTARDEED